MSNDVTTSAISKPKRYHPALVALHWVIAILIFITPLFVGEGGEGRGAGGALSFGGISALGIHMILGITVLALLVVCLMIRWRTQRPAWATTGSAFLDKFGELTHWGLYFFTFAIIITGLVLALQSNRFARAFNLAGKTPPQFPQGQQGQFQPPEGSPRGQFPPGGFEGEGRFPQRGGFFLGAFHGLSWTLLLLLILLHIGAALYHQFWRRDNLLGRMWFGQRDGERIGTRLGLVPIFLTWGIVVKTHSGRAGRTRPR